MPTFSLADKVSKMETTNTPICPHCSSEALYLIGAILRGQLATKYVGSVTKDLLVDLNPEVYQGLVICRDCKRQMTTSELEEFNNLKADDTLWETNTDGYKIPIVCPVCANRKAFIKVISAEQHVRVPVVDNQAQGALEFSNRAEDIVSSHTIRYECANGICDGVVVL